MAAVGQAEEGGGGGCRRRSWVAALARAGLCALLAAPLAGCTPRVKLRVEPSAIAELPLERKLTLLDAENDLLSAVDARDIAEERMLAAHDAIDDAWNRKREADEQRDKAKKAGLPLDVPDAALRESELRIDWCRADLDLSRAQLRSAESASLLAQARYEQSRATEVLEAGLPGSRGLRAADFQAQTDRLARFAQERAAETAARKEATDRVAARWTQARTDLTRLTGGAQGSAWVQ
jgi:hypothetical protein